MFFFVLDNMSTSFFITALVLTATAFLVEDITAMFLPKRVLLLFKAYFVIHFIRGVTLHNFYVYAALHRIDDQNSFG